MRMRTMMSVLAVLAIGLVGYAGYEVSNDSPGRAVSILALGGVLGMASPALRDAALKLTRALPGSATTVYSLGIDTGVTPAGQQPDAVEYLLTAPALTTAQLGDAATMKYSILLDTVNPVDGSSVARHTDCLVQTGAGAAGAAGATFRFKLASDSTRILGFKIVNSAAGDCSAVSATLEALF